MLTTRCFRHHRAHTLREEAAAALISVSNWAKQEDIAFNAGTFEAVVVMRVAAFIALAKPVVGNFARGPFARISPLHQWKIPLSLVKIARLLPQAASKPMAQRLPSSTV